MALNALKWNHLTPLGLKGLRLISHRVGRRVMLSAAAENMTGRHMYPFNVLSQFLNGVVGVGDSDGDHAADELHLAPQFECLTSNQLLALGAYDRRAMSLALCSTQVVASKAQPRVQPRHAVQQSSITVGKIAFHLKTNNAFENRFCRATKIASAVLGVIILSVRPFVCHTRAL